jgi:hypothetical protein
MWKRAVGSVVAEVSKDTSALNRHNYSSNDTTPHLRRILTSATPLEEIELSLRNSHKRQ